MEQVTGQSSVSRSFRALLQRKKQTTHTPENGDRPHGISLPRKITSPSHVSKEAKLVQSMPTPTKAKGRLSTRERRKNHRPPSMITDKRSSKASAERENAHQERRVTSGVKKIPSTSFQLDSTLSKSAKDTNGNLKQPKKQIRDTRSSSSAPPSTVPEEFLEADVSTISSVGSALNDISEGTAHLNIESLDEEDVQLFCDNEKPMHDSTATPHLSVGGTSSTKTNKLNPHASEFYPEEGSKRKPTTTCALPSSVYNTLNTQGGDKQSHTRGTTRVKHSTHEATNSKKAANITGLARAIRMCSFRKYVDTNLSVSPNMAADKKRQGRKRGQAPPIRPRAISANIAETYSCPRVTMLDDTFKVFVIDLVPPQICDLMLQLTEDHVLNAATLARETWRKLYTYTSLDLPCCEVVTLRGFISQILNDICKIIGDVFRAPKSAARLKPRTWKEPHMLRYQKVKGKPSHTGVKLHYDGSHMTWQLMLSDGNEYDGE
jgi:hypothetical protein